MRRNNNKNLAAKKKSAEKKIRLTCKHQALTWSQCDVSMPDILDQVRAAAGQIGLSLLEYIICHELHEDGNPHRHGLLIFSRAPEWVDPRWLDITRGDDVYHPQIEDVKRLHKWTKYVIEEGDYITNCSKERIEELLIPTVSNKLDLDKIAADLMAGTDPKDLLQIYPGLFWKLKDMKDNLFIFKEIMHGKPAKKDNLENYWYLGNTGVGKSRFVYDHWPDAFKKEKSEFWGSYCYEEVVVCEEMSGEWPVEDFKVWTDWYPFPARVKHKDGFKSILPKIFVVTSNYTIEEVVAQYCSRKGVKMDHIMVKALERRFTVKKIEDNNIHEELKNSMDNIYSDNYIFGDISYNKFDGDIFNLFD